LKEQIPVVSAVSSQENPCKALIDEIIKDIVQLGLPEKKAFSFPAAKLPGSIFLEGIKPGKTVVSRPPGSAPETPRFVLKGFGREKRAPQKDTKGKHHSSPECFRHEKHPFRFFATPDLYWGCTIKPPAPVG